MLQLLVLAATSADRCLCERCDCGCGHASRAIETPAPAMRLLLRLVVRFQSLPAPAASITLLLPVLAASRPQLSLQCLAAICGRLHCTPGPYTLPHRCRASAAQYAPNSSAPPAACPLTLRPWVRERSPMAWVASQEVALTSLPRASLATVPPAPPPTLQHAGCGAVEVGGSGGRRQAARQFKRAAAQRCSEGGAARRRRGRRWSPAPARTGALRLRTWGARRTARRGRPGPRQARPRRPAAAGSCRGRRGGGQTRASSPVPLPGVLAARASGSSAAWGHGATPLAARRLPPPHISWRLPMSGTSALAAAARTTTEARRAAGRWARAWKATLALLLSACAILPIAAVQTGALGAGCWRLSPS